jgi:hypothetical protein
LHEQGPLSDCEFRLGPDAEHVRAFFAATIVMIGAEGFQGRPLLAFMTNTLPLIFTDWAAGRRPDALGELSPARHADEISHCESYRSSSF